MTKWPHPVSASLTKKQPSRSDVQVFETQTDKPMFYYTEGGRPSGLYPSAEAALAAAEQRCSELDGEEDEAARRLRKARGPRP